ncbi:hypothetical protein F7734_05515 [Scytonema sp. UIC 10036]|uniref:hypothetical protein n=1 Tax=Scytonema sp. UIC 10036 TaxID=2304196 RepID=UPI0012DACED9|nr:hypothetical protein [Scytonema sp. UIC 10036]MUG91947.1 hypothetical protein [Scytonema sp. UIC 10036]
MSIYGNSMQAFIDVFKSGLISPEEWNEFCQQTQNLQEDEDISEAIENWVESRPEILKAYEERLEVLNSSSSVDLDTNLGPGNAKSPTLPGQRSQSSRELLDNAIPKKNPSASDPPPAKP